MMKMDWCYLAKRFPDKENEINQLIDRSKEFLTLLVDYEACEKHIEGLISTKVTNVLELKEYQEILRHLENEINCYLKEL